MWKASCCIGITVSSGPSTSVVCGTVTTCAASPLRQSAQNAQKGQRIREQHRLEAARPAARRRCCACGTCRSVLAGCARKDARLIVAHRSHAETYCTILQVVALYCNRLHYNATGCTTMQRAVLSRTLSSSLSPLVITISSPPRARTSSMLLLICTAKPLR